MSLNIKNPETHRLAQELAGITGESMSMAVNAALRERLARLRRDQKNPLSARLLSIGKDCAPRLKDPFPAAEPSGSLYGDDGLPR